jgi:hypothetical protein
MPAGIALLDMLDLLWLRRAAQYCVAPDGTPSTDRAFPNARGG